MAIDATVAGASANSYLTVSDADALATKKFGPEALHWQAAPPLHKEQALMRATEEIDAELYSGWRPYTAGQALLFPREIHVDTNGPYIHKNVKLATYHQAVYVLRNVKVLDDARTRRARDLQTASEPNMSYVERGGMNPQTPPGDHRPEILSDMARHYLKRFTRVDSMRTMRSVRMAAGVWR